MMLVIFMHKLLMKNLSHKVFVARKLRNHVKVYYANEIETCTSAAFHESSMSDFSRCRRVALNAFIFEEHFSCFRIHFISTLCLLIIIYSTPSPDDEFLCLPLFDFPLLYGCKCLSSPRGKCNILSALMRATKHIFMRH